LRGSISEELSDCKFFLHREECEPRETTQALTGRKKCGINGSSNWNAQWPETALLIYAAATFLSAFLLFLIQPMVGKRILPWFGGTPGVWTTCLLFFQVALLGGYAYAHWISTRLTPRRQVIAHLALLAAALPFLPVYPGQ